MSRDKLERFLNYYTDILNDVDYKIAFFKDLSDSAFADMTQLLPKINTKLKEIVKEIGDTESSLKDSGLTDEELKGVDDIINDIKNIPDIILEIMTSLQVQDAVKQSIEHIIKSLDITRKYVGSVDKDSLDNESFKIIKFLKVMPELIAAQLSNNYNSMDESLRLLPRRFHSIAEILRPSITLEQLLAGKEEINKMRILKEELGKCRDKSDTKDKQLTLFEDLISKADKYEKEIPDIANMLDLSSAAPRRLEQPLAEILMLDSKLNNATNTAEDLLEVLYDGDPEELDIKEMLEQIVSPMSTKDEIDAARKVLKYVEIEEAGDEGNLELF